MEFSEEELRSIALEAEMLHHNSKLKGCRRKMESVAEWLEEGEGEINTASARPHLLSTIG
jgi:hypothetical protein